MTLPGPCRLSAERVLGLLLMRCMSATVTSFCVWQCGRMTAAESDYCVWMHEVAGESCQLVSSWLVYSWILTLMIWWQRHCRLGPANSSRVVDLPVGA
ncbi:hypothetical protein HDV57DRAFT_272016 [Trichoderma longibrachiatum]